MAERSYISPFLTMVVVSILPGDIFRIRAKFPLFREISVKKNWSGGGEPSRKLNTRTRKSAKKETRFRSGQAGPEWLRSRSTVMMKPVESSGATPLPKNILVGPRWGAAAGNMAAVNNAKNETF